MKKDYLWCSNAGASLGLHLERYTREYVPPVRGIRFTEASKTKQSFKEECDINTIVKRFGVTGVLPSSVRMPTYGDFTDVGDFREAMEAIRTANESFAEMPSEVRERFQNDPAKFVDFCSDEKNLPEARKLGLAPAEEVKSASKGGEGSPTGEKAA